MVRTGKQIPTLVANCVYSEQFVQNLQKKKVARDCRAWCCGWPLVERMGVGVVEVTMSTLGEGGSRARFVSQIHDEQGNLWVCDDWFSLLSWTSKAISL